MNSAGAASHPLEARCASTIAAARERVEAERREAERRRQAAEAEKARRVRLKILKQRGASSVWREIEQEIERRNPTGYDKAIALLSDLQALAGEEGNQDDFQRRPRLDPGTA